MVTKEIETGMVEKLNIQHTALGNTLINIRMVITYTSEMGRGMVNFVLLLFGNSKTMTRALTKNNKNYWLYYLVNRWRHCNCKKTWNILVSSSAEAVKSLKEEILDAADLYGTCT